MQDLTFEIYKVYGLLFFSDFPPLSFKNHPKYLIKQDFGGLRLAKITKYMISPKRQSYTL
jgi:hypothetical protein